MYDLRSFWLIFSFADCWGEELIFEGASVGAMFDYSGDSVRSPLKTPVTKKLNPSVSVHTCAEDAGDCQSKGFVRDNPRQTRCIIEGNVQASAGSCENYEFSPKLFSPLVVFVDWHIMHVWWCSDVCMLPCFHAFCESARVMVSMQWSTDIEGFFFALGACILYIFL